MRGLGGQSVCDTDSSNFFNCELSEGIDPPALVTTSGGCHRGYFAFSFNLLLSILATAFGFPKSTVVKNQFLLELHRQKL